MKTRLSKAQKNFSVTPYPSNESMLRVDEAETECTRSAHRHKPPKHTTNYRAAQRRDEWLIANSKRRSVLQLQPRDHLNRAKIKLHELQSKKSKQEKASKTNYPYDFSRLAFTLFPSSSPSSSPSSCKRFIGQRHMLICKFSQVNLMMNRW